MIRAPRRRPAPARLPRPMLGGIVALAVAAGFITWLVTRSDGGPSTAATTSPATTARPVATPVGPIALSASSLRALAGSLGQPVYWIGPVPGRRYGLTREANGNVFVRYLPAGARPGDKRRLLLIGTYPFKGAFAATKALTKELGTAFRILPDGGLLFYRLSAPANVYLVYPRLDYQIEVFDPSPAKARQLVVSGKIRRVR